MNKGREIHRHAGILDFERGREDRVTRYHWVPVTSSGPGFHHNVLPHRSTDNQIDVQVDIVAKNGCMLLSAGPRADGAIP